MARKGAARAALWCCVALACPSAVTAVFLRPALLVFAYVFGAAGVVVPAHLLVRDRPPWHRCPPRHARHGHVGVDTDTRLTIADIQRRLDRHERAWRLAGILRRGDGQHELRLIRGGGDDDPGNGDSEASLTTLPGAA